MTIIVSSARWRPFIRRRELPGDNMNTARRRAEAGFSLLQGKIAVNWSGGPSRKPTKISPSAAKITKIGLYRGPDRFMS
jgi:hypothetical protein